jgi:hypothetical protein
MGGITVAKTLLRAFEVRRAAAAAALLRLLRCCGCWAAALLRLLGCCAAALLTTLVHVHEQQAAVSGAHLALFPSQLIVAAVTLGCAVNANFMPPPQIANAEAVLLALGLTCATTIVICTIYLATSCCKCSRKPFNNPSGLIAEVLLGSVWAAFWFLLAIVITASFVQGACPKKEDTMCVGPVKEHRCRLFSRSEAYAALKVDLLLDLGVSDASISKTIDLGLAKMGLRSVDLGVYCSLWTCAMVFAWVAFICWVVSIVLPSVQLRRECKLQKLTSPPAGASPVVPGATRIATDWLPATRAAALPDCGKYHCRGRRHSGDTLFATTGANSPGFAFSSSSTISIVLALASPIRIAIRAVQVNTY